MSELTQEYKVIRQNEVLLNLLRFYKGIDKSELSRRLQLSMPTIYKAIDELKNADIIKSDSAVSINKDFGILAGVSIGTSLCKIVLLGFDFQLLDPEIFLPYKHEICQKISEISPNDELLDKCISNDAKQYIYFKTPKTFHTLKDILDAFFACLKSYIADKKLNILSIGVSCTGIINNKTQTILDAYNLDYLSNTTLDSLIYPDKQAFFDSEQIQVFLVQNSHASVIAEKIYLNSTNSIHKSRENIIALYFGVGTGAGLYLGHLYEGTNGHAGEAGHTKAPVLESAEDIRRHDDLVAHGIVDKYCTCRCNDCYDYKIRSYVFEKTAEKFCDMSAEEIREYLKTNPSKAVLLGRYLGSMVNTLTSWLNIDLIIFTGKLYKSMDLLLNHIEAVRDESPLKFNRNDCKIITSAYGSLSPSIGAAIYAYHKKYDLNLSWNC